MTATLPVTGNTEQTRPENRAFYPALDGMRAIAFLMVFFEHYTAMRFGWSGVDAFFVLSGFLITGILFDTRDDLHRVRNFYLRRTLRIFPLYYGIMLVLLLLNPIMRWQWSWKWLVWPAYLGNYARFLHPYAPYSLYQMLADFQPTAAGHGHHITLFLGHFWSLCVEEQFYLFWPWLVFWVRDRRKILWICMATLPLCLGLRLIAEQIMPGWLLNAGVLYSGTPFRLDALLLGGLLALALRGPRAQALLRMARFLFPVVVATAVCGYSLCFLHLWRGFHFTSRFVFTWGLTTIDWLAALVLLQAIQPGTLVYRVLKIRPLRWLGRISYGAYVLHDIPHLLYRRFSDNYTPGYATQTTTVLGLFMTILLAWLSFRFYETPFLNLKERWTTRSTSRPVHETRVPR